MGRADVLSVLTAHRSDLDGFGILSLRLFGSVAREEASTDSDVDLLVSFQGKPTFSGFMKLRIFLEDLLGVKVDLVTESVSERPSVPMSRRMPFVLRNARGRHSDH